MSNPQLRFKVNAEMEQALYQRKLHLKQRLIDVESFNALDEIAYFYKQQKSQKVRANYKDYTARKAQGILMMLPEVQSADAALQFERPPETVEDSSEIDTIEHDDVQRVTLQQELDYLRYRALMAREDKYYGQYQELAKTHRVEYEYKIKAARYTICRQLLEELICDVCGSIDQAQAFDAFNSKCCEIELLFPRYDAQMQVCVDKKADLLRGFLDTGSLYGETVYNGGDDVYDFTKQMNLDREVDTTLSVSLSDKFGIQEATEHADLLPALHIRLVTHDEALLLDYQEIRRVVGDENLFFMQTLDYYAIAAYKNYFAYVADYLKQIQGQFKPKAAGKTPQQLYPAKQKIQLDDRFMTIPTMEIDKFVKSSTAEQVVFARIHYLMYRRAGLVPYWILEQLQLGTTTKTAIENDFLEIELINGDEIPIQATVCLSIKGPKGLSDVEQVFAFVSNTKIKFYTLYRYYNTAEASEYQSNTGQKPVTPKRDGKRVEPQDTFKTNVELSQKGKYAVVYYSAFDEVIYVSKNTVVRFQQNVTYYKSGKGKGEQDYTDQLSSEIEQKSLFQFKELADIYLVEAADDAPAALAAMYKTDLTRLVFVRYSEFYTLSAVDCSRLDLSFLEVHQPFLCSLQYNIDTNVQQALSRLFGVAKLSLERLACRFSYEAKNAIISAICSRVRAYALERYYEVLFQLHLLMKTLFQASTVLNANAFAAISAQLNELINNVKALIPGPQFTAAYQTEITDEVHAMREKLAWIISETVYCHSSIPCFGEQLAVAYACESVDREAVDAKITRIKEYLARYLASPETIAQFEAMRSQYTLNDVFVLEAALRLDRILSLQFAPYYVFQTLRSLLRCVPDAENLCGERFDVVVGQMVSLESALCEKLVLRANTPEDIDDIYTDILHKFELAKSARALYNSVFALVFALKFEMRNAAERAEKASQTLYLLCLQAVRRGGRVLSNVMYYLEQFGASLYQEREFSVRARENAANSLVASRSCAWIKEQFERISRPQCLLSEITDVKSAVILHRAVDCVQYAEKYQLSSERVLRDVAGTVFVVVKHTITHPDAASRTKRVASPETVELTYYNAPILQEISYNIAPISETQFDTIIAALRYGPLRYLTQYQTQQVSYYSAQQARSQQKNEPKRAKETIPEQNNAEDVIVSFGETSVYKAALEALNQQNIIQSVEETGFWITSYLNIFAQVQINEKYQTQMLAIALAAIPVRNCDYECKLVKLFEMQEQRAVKFVSNVAAIRDVIQLLWTPQSDGFEVDNFQCLYTDVSAAVRSVFNEITASERTESPKLSARRVKK